MGAAEERSRRPDLGAGTVKPQIGRQQMAGHRLDPAGIVAEPTSPQLLNSLPVGRQASRQVSTPTLVNNIIWQNRSFYFDGKRQNATTKVIPMVSSNTHCESPIENLPVHPSTMPQL